MLVVQCKCGARRVAGVDAWQVNCLHLHHASNGERHEDE